jgi:hypothetical protein
MYEKMQSRCIFSYPVFTPDNQHTETGYAERITPRTFSASPAVSEAEIPAVGTGAWITSLTVCERKRPVFSKTPAVFIKVTGRISAPARDARWKLPGRNSPILPVLLRVPSGKITIGFPRARDFTPRSRERKLLFTLPLSIKTQCSINIQKFKTGINASSLFATKPGVIPE